LVAAYVLSVSAADFLFLVLAIAWVWFAEAVNTAIERLADAVTLEHHPEIKVAKDVAAAAVLIASITSVAIGITILVPLITHLFRP
jgi:diacylglycerol kinase